MQQDLTDLLQDDTTKSSVSLNLSRRNIETLPDAIGTLQHLEILSLASNKLTSLPISMNGLTSLRYLNLRSNAIREFPMVLCNMPSLEILDLSRNKLKRLPQVFGSLLTLKVLSIARNRIQSLPVYIGKMTRLEVLKLDGNPIQWPPPDVLNCADEENAEEWLNGVKEFLGKDHSPGIDVTTNTFTDSTPAFQLQKPIDLTKIPQTSACTPKRVPKNATSSSTST
ncbi:hypothetical protein BC829DRAFT_284628 [Chytridium lagenaria]|nr:hypothetical protein BC829DRAFT_284628 [Chytridium lagenaria]